MLFDRPLRRRRLRNIRYLLGGLTLGANRESAEWHAAPWGIGDEEAA